MTGRQSDHSIFAELAAGYALHALEPVDEQILLRHAAQCWRCRQALAEFQEVAALLAETAPAAEARAGLSDRILAAASAGPCRDGQDVWPVPATATRSQVVPLQRRRSQGRLRWAATAAAAAVIVAGGVWGGLATTSGTAPAPLAMCMQPHTCAQVTLVAARTHLAAGKVVVAGDRVWMLPTGMTANNPAGQIYVLWQITGTHTPLPVGSFDVPAGLRTPILIGGLAAPYQGTWAFAVSLEHGRTIPAAPSAEIALGQVP